MPEANRSKSTDKILEVIRVLRLAAPIVALQVGLMFFGVVDTWFMGRVSQEAIASVGLGHAVIFGIFSFGMGFLYGVDSLCAHAFGARNPQRAALTVVHSLFIAIFLGAIFLIVLTTFGPSLIALTGSNAEVQAGTLLYLSYLKWFFFPALLFMAARQYLQALGRLRFVLLILLAGNLLNAALNQVLVLGKLGFPAMGIAGSGVATLIANFSICVVVLAFLFRCLRQQEVEIFRFDKQVLRDLIRLGVPGGFQTLLEVSVFGFVSLMMGHFGASILAAHQISLNLASLTFMVPLGVSYAASVLVANARGANDFALSKRLGEIALIVGIGFMVFTSLLFIFGARLLLRLYTEDTVLIEAGASLMRIAGIFQLVDGAQVVLTGMMRGLGNTRISMLANLFGHWCIGFPLGLYLAFRSGVGPIGLWLGLTAGLASVSLVLALAWKRESRRLFLPV